MESIADKLKKLKEVSESLNSIVSDINIDEEINKIEDKSIKNFLSDSATKAKAGNLDVNNFVSELNKRVK